MTNHVPFCERCGRPGVTMSGLHPSDDGLVRWTLFRCGHLRTEIEMAGVVQAAGRLDTAGLLR